MAVGDLSPLIESLSQAASRSEQARVQTLLAIRALQFQLENQHDYYMRSSFSHFQVAAARIAGDLDIYAKLAESSKPLTVVDLAAQTGASPVLIRRIVRYLAAEGHVEETDKDTFAANKMTKVLALPGPRGATWNMHTNCGPGILSLPDYLKENKYQDVCAGEEVARNPSQAAWNTDEPFMKYLSKMPENWKHFQQHMTAVQEGFARWFEVFPFAAELGDFSGPDVFVDVGGGLGHQCTRLLAAFPQLHGKMVLQDLPETIAQVDPVATDGVRKMAHNFFDEQPIRGAKFYYLRIVLHNWSDRDCVTILGRLRDAMEPGSSVLINDIVMPNTGAHWQSTVMDLAMMCYLGARERSEDEWHELLKQAGLRITRIDTHNHQTCDSLIQAVRI